MVESMQDLVKALSSEQKETSKTYTAVVSHTDEEGIVWVRLPGAEQDTPTASTSAEVKMGDTVTVEWRNNKLYIAGNYTNPSAGVERVAIVDETAHVAKETAGEAQAAADEAQTTADGAQTTAQTAQTAADLANNTLFGGYVDVAINSEGSLDSDTITVDIDSFAEQVGSVYGTYTFVYEGTGWMLDGSSVDLAEYGITISGAPTTGDTIVADYGDVVGLAATVSDNAETLSTARETMVALQGDVGTLSNAVNGVAEQAEIQAQGIADLQGTADSLAESIEDTVERATTMEGVLTHIGDSTEALTIWMDEQKAESERVADSIEALQTAITALQSAVANADGTIAWLRFGTDSLGNPVLSIGGGQDAALEVAISNSQMQFKENDQPVSYISGEKMHITSAEITNELRFGDFAFIPRNNGNLSLKYVGGDES